MAEGISAVTQAGWATPGEGRPAKEEAPANDVDKEMFLQLLVAQIKHQDPLNPADGIEFLTQLAEFSGLEQMMEVRKELEGIHSSIDDYASRSLDTAETEATEPAG